MQRLGEKNELGMSGNQSREKTWNSVDVVRGRAMRNGREVTSVLREAVVRGSAAEKGTIVFLY